MTRPRRVLIVAALALVAIGAGSYLLRASQGARGPASRPVPAVPVTAAAVVAKTVPVRLRAIGNVEPYTTVALKARVDGQIVARPLQGRRRGQARARCCSRSIARPFEAQSAAGAGEPAQGPRDCSITRASRKSATRTCSRRSSSRPMPTSRCGPTPRPRRRRWAPTRPRSRARRLQIEYCTIRAPITGYAGKIMIQQGNLVKANDTNAARDRSTRSCRSTRRSRCRSRISTRDPHATRPRASCR